MMRSWSKNILNHQDILKYKSLVISMAIIFKRKRLLYSTKIPKIIEEAPSVHVDETLRNKMNQASY